MPMADRIVIWTILLFAIMPAVSGNAAGSPARECVANQLNALKDRQTRTPGAMSPHLTSARIQQLEYALDRMTKPLLIVTCNWLATLDEDLVRHWPSFERRVRIILSADFEPKRAEISEILEAELASSIQMFGHNAPLTVIFLIGNDPTDLDAKARALGWHPETRTDTGVNWKMQCDEPGVISGYADQFTAVVCLPGEAELYDLSDPDAGRIFRTVVTHEYMHAFQGQVAGGFHAKPYADNPVRGLPGPAWMLEGIAHYAGYRSAEKTGNIRARVERTISDYGYSKEDVCQILARQEASYESTAGPRAVAIQAVMNLETFGGPGSFARFYTDLGITQDWRKSFSRTYGGSPEEVLECTGNKSGAVD